MKRIGIFTWFNVQNYGTALQAFALYTFLTKKNEVYLVDYFNTKKIYCQPFFVTVYFMLLN